jgi:hypothetical protein
MTFEWDAVRVRKTLIAWLLRDERWRSSDRKGN